MSGFKILGPFYVITRLFGLLLIREVSNKIGCPKKENGSNQDGDTSVKDTGGVTVVYLPDKRYLAYSALLMVSYYLTFRRCVLLAGGFPCKSAADCAAAVEWSVAAAGATLSMVSVAVAALHRRLRTACLLNRTHGMLSTRGTVGWTGAATHRQGAHLIVGATYGAIAVTVMMARLAALTAAWPDRFTATDVMLLYAPAAIAPIAVECTIVCVCSVAENTCWHIVDRLDELTAHNGHGWAPRAERRRTVEAYRRLETTMHDYREVCRLVNSLSECYGLDLAVNLTASMLFFIVYAYLTIMSVYAACTGVADPTDNHLYWNVSLVCQLLCVSFRIVFISYRAEKIKQVATHLVLISLRNLLKENNLNISSVMLINSFTYQITNRELKVSACGFFSVNLSFFHALIRLATTYLIVIIQYNADSLQQSSTKKTKQ